jgi:hypothetical protein
MRAATRSGFARFDGEAAATSSDTDTFSATVCSGEGNGSSTFPP